MSGYTHEWLAERVAANPQLRIAKDSGPSRVPIPETAAVLPSPSVSPATPHKPRKDYKAELIQQCELVGLKLEPEFRFHPERKFRADWLVIGTKVLIDYEGGIFSTGKRGHSSVSGIRRDIEKSNLAQICGYLVIRVAPDHVVSGQALKWIELAVAQTSLHPTI